MIGWVVCSSAILFLSDAGRVEVEGLVVSAIAKPIPMQRMGNYGEYELEMTINAKQGTPYFDFNAQLKVIDDKGRPIAYSAQFPFLASNGSAKNRWTARVTCSKPIGTTLPAVEGSLIVVPATWKSMTFEGAAFKPNASIPIEGGTAKLIVLDLADEHPEVRARLTLQERPRGAAIPYGARARLIDAKGDDVLLRTGSGGPIGGSTVGLKEFDYLYKFDAVKPLQSDFKKVQLDVPIPQGQSKTASFRIANVPITEAGDARKVDR